jgi:hypothetical protein
VVAFSFGLLHGLGFAGALAEIGLPHGEIPLALFSFNVGVELGQLAFIAVVLLLNYVARRLVERVPDWAPRAAAYAIGCTAAYWVFQPSRCGPEADQRASKNESCSGASSRVPCAWSAGGVQVSPG